VINWRNFGVREADRENDIKENTTNPLTLPFWDVLIQYCYSFSIRSFISVLQYIIPILMHGYASQEHWGPFSEAVGAARVAGNVLSSL
jgi:hypothetical protein